MSIACVLIKWVNVADKDVTNPSKYLVLNKNYNPVSLPVVGLADDLEVFVKREPYPVPDEDSRLVLIQNNEMPVDELDLEHTNNRIWLKTYSVVPRSKDDLKISVDESKGFANLRLLPEQEQLEMLALYTALERKERKGGVLSDAENAYLQKGDAVAQKLWYNRTVATAKKTDIDNDLTPDLDNGWEVE